jgi:hypothetical protein
VLPLRSVLRLSQPPDGLLHLRLRGFISPRSHVQGFAPSRGFSRSAAVPTRRRAMPPCRCRSPADRQAGRHG